MTSEGKPKSEVTQNLSDDNKIVIGGDVVDSVVISGNDNTVNVNKTFVQKFFNIFKSDAETVDQRNRRIMLGHVENFWVKGILEKSLHGAALLELGIKEDPDALTYPWTIKREPTREILPAGTSMLEIFREIGLGRSLLILGVPGSGKTTMLLELTRQLIERAREDVTEPIPVVFNLSSWTEKLSLADWLARELNVIYTIPNKIAPTWVKENKMLLLLDGLDEVRQESRDNCVDAINQFRKENGLTNMAVCSRSQDYAELATRLSFDGAIEIQHLTPSQVKEYFERFGTEMTGIRKVLENDTVLSEMAETPLFLSIMTLAYRGTDLANILVSENAAEQRKHLFDTYIERMFARPERSNNERFKRQDVLHYLPWLAHRMIEHNQVPLLIERIQPGWLDQRKRVRYYRLVSGLIGGLISGLSFGLVGGLISGLSFGLVSGLIGGLNFVGSFVLSDEIDTVDKLTWNSKKVIGKLRDGFRTGLMLIGMLIVTLFLEPSFGPVSYLIGWFRVGLIGGLMVILFEGLEPKEVEIITLPGERLFLSTKNFLLVSLMFGLIGGLGFGLISGSRTGLMLIGVLTSVLFSVQFVGLRLGGYTIIHHYALRYVLSNNNLIPWKLIPFLDHCTDLIFLRRIGGGYIFVHRLLMEHFAAMYQEEPK